MRHKWGLVAFLAAVMAVSPLLADHHEAKKGETVECKMKDCDKAKCDKCKDGKPCADCAKKCEKAGKECDKSAKCDMGGMKCDKCKDGKPCADCLKKCKEKCEKAGKKCDMSKCDKEPACPMGKKLSEMTPEERASFEAWKAYSAPSASHKVLEKLAGSWDHVIKMWMAPGTEPVETKGQTEARLILGGRFVEETVTGEFMGQPFEGRGLTGYDNAQKKYISIWTDNMVTGIMQGSGTYDAGKRAILETGTMPDPRGAMPYRSVNKFISSDKRTFELFVTGPGGKEFRTMEITYTRKAK